MQKNMQKEITYGHIRVQLLAEDILRVEYGKGGRFCDRNTLIIPDRESLPGVDGLTAEGNTVTVGGYRLELPEKSRSLNGLRLYSAEGKLLYVYRRKNNRNTGELPPLSHTPEVFAVYDNPRIRVPESGYSYRGERKNNGYRMEEGAEDVYLLLCGKDFRRLRRQFVRLTGRNEMVRLSVFGLWDSRWYPYSEQTAKGRILDYPAHGLPLDNLVIDTDWRKASDRGMGYDVNTELFPDLAGFLRFAHEQGVEVMFNDHPEPLTGATSVLDPKEVRYREEKLRSLLSMGADIWWYDRNWWTKLISPVKGILPETFGMYLFTDVTKHFWQEKAHSKTVYRRPVIMGNVNNIENGVYNGIADTVSHRFSIQWTGDTGSDFPTLRREIRNMMQASDSGIAYINSDCGGHWGNPDSTAYIRWFQFGVFSPVLRPHCTLTLPRSREPWVYGEETLETVRRFIRLRYRLLPLIYQCAFRNYETGEPIFRSPAYEYPDDKRALAERESYLLGKNLLISPVTGEDPKLLSPAPDCYIQPVKATYYRGTHWEGEPLCEVEVPELKLHCDRTPPHPGVPADHFSVRFETVLKFDEDVTLWLTVHDDAKVWVDGEVVTNVPYAHEYGAVYPICPISGGKEHTLKVEYFKTEGWTVLELHYALPIPLAEHTTRLPAGRWMDVFDGKIYRGGRSVRKTYPVERTALFVRLGGVVPLAYNAKNTKEQKWDQLVFDLYPDRDAGDEGYLYEDDTETTAYKLGQYRVSRYESGFDPARRVLYVHLSPSEGTFRGERTFGKRTVTFKLHQLSGFGRVRGVTVNGTTAEFCKTPKDVSAFPLDTCPSAPDADTVTVTTPVDLSEDTRIEFQL